MPILKPVKIKKANIAAAMTSSMKVSPKIIKFKKHPQRSKSPKRNTISERYATNKISKVLESKHSRTYIPALTKNSINFNEWNAERMNTYIKDT